MVSLLPGRARWQKIWQGSWDIPISIQGQCTGLSLCTVCSTVSLQRPDTYLNGVKVEKEIRGMEVANRVSPIAALGFVRRAMVAKQQEMGKAKGIVMDGRDIGTVVFPDAELKIYVTASPEVRAQRRLDELKAKGEVASFEEVLENVKTRDHIDMTRVESPLRKADDALELDNSHLTIAEQKAWLLEQYEKVVTSD